MAVLLLASSPVLLVVLVACQLAPASSSALPTSPTNHTTVAAAIVATSPTPAPSAIAATPTVPPVPTVTATPGEENVALHAAVSVSSGDSTAKQAVDGDPKTLWSAGGQAPQTITLTLDHAYLVDSIQLVVAQTPDGQTTHEIWLGDPSGSLTLYKKLDDTWTADGDTVTIPVTPARVVTRVQVRTDDSPSYVAWREIRVLGKPPGAGANAQTGGTPPAAPEVDWPKIASVGDFDQPVQVTNAADGTNRMFVAERPGRIRIVENGELLPKPFLDITDKVKCCVSEQGFFSVAFPPDFKAKQYFYVSYTARPSPGQFGPIGDTVIARYHVTADPNVADPKSEQIILVIPKKTDAHNGGHLAFGPKDGYLYIGIGDGGLQNDPTNEAQNPDSLQGKILRIDTESGVKPYAIPPTNPFVNMPGHRPEVWALGLRNPWQFSFDQQTGDLYIGEVGENNYEEVDFQPADSRGGENYGWRIMEGDHCHLSTDCDQYGLTFPVTEYTHADGCAIIGGTVYRGKRYPDLDGIYFYSDLCTGKIWGLKRIGDQWVSNLLYDEPFQVTSIGTDEQGNIYVTDFSDGAIFAIVQAAA